MKRRNALAAAFCCGLITSTPGALSAQSCLTAADCGPGLVCEDGTCMVPACGSNSECGAGQVCSGGACIAAPTASSVARCDVTPVTAPVEAGSTLALKALAIDSAGRGLPFSGFTWSASGGSATVSINGVVTGAGNGVTTITASAGNSASCSATVTTFPTIAAGQLRVVVIDADTKLPIPGAIVVVDGARLSGATDLQGQVTAAVGPGSHDVHVFAAAHDYVSLLHTVNTDLLVPLPRWAPLASRPYFQGTMSAADFANLFAQGESLHVALFGSSIPGSPLEISGPALLGPLWPATSLPSGLVTGIGQNMVTDQYRIFAPAGKRALWGFGGNLSLTALAAAPSLAGNAGNIDIDQVVSQLLPLVNKLQAGSVLDADVNSASSPIAASVPLNTRLRLRVTPTMPRLPLQDGKYLGGALVVGGALDYPLGFVPLGITAGVSQKLHGKTTGKLLDPTCDTSAGSEPCATGLLPMRVAPQGNGLEGSTWAFLAMASNSDGLSDGSLGVSALVKTAAEIPYVVPPAAGTTIDFTARGFMNLPGARSVTLAKAKRSFTVSADADASTRMYRFRLSNNAHLNWYVWMPSTAVAGGAIAVTLPDPSVLDSSLVDPLQDAIGDDGKRGRPSALLASVSTGDGSTYGTVTGFAPPRLDQLGASIDAFTIVSVPIK